MIEENSNSPENNEENEKPIIKEIKSKFKFQIKTIGILLIFAFFFLTLAVISYHKSDIEESNIRISDLYGLLNKNPDIIARQATTENWLGLVGAFFSDKLINNTFGYPVLLLLISGIMWCWSLFKNLKITPSIIRHTSFLVLLMLFLSGFFGIIQKFTWLGQLPFEWSGNVGFFLSTITSGVFGNIGAFIIFMLSIFLTIFYKLDFKFSDIIKQVYSNIKNGSKKTKETESEEAAEENKEFSENDINNENPASINDYGYTIKTVNVPKSNFLEETENSDAVTGGIHQNDPVNKGQNPFSPSLKILDNVQKDFPSAQNESEPAKFVPKIQNIDPAKLSISNPELQKEYIEEISHYGKQNKNESVKDNNKENSAVRSVLLDSINDENNTKNIKVNIIDEPIAEENDLKPLIYAAHSNYKLKFKFPATDLLVKPTTQASVDKAELQLNARILQEKLETFKIEITDLSVTPGPVVTQYEFVPAPGIKISKIEALEDDLAMALKAKGIRIIAPIPGRGTIGVEVPNSNPQIVHFSDVVSTEKYRRSEARLPLALGKTINGDIFIEDLTRMPHLLIAGSTGSGKSVGINTIINSLLYKVPPSDLKFVIIDPKKVELPQYAALSQHYLATSQQVDDLIVSNPKDAVSILKSTVLEMENRYNILQDAMQRNISDYNKKLEDGTLRKSDKILHQRMPYIVVVIDELADLMLTASKEIEEPIARLAQMARAVGIHLVVATQRPSVDVITGVIKANFPARIAYLVAQKVDSRTILDQGGADQLLGNGDMLFLPPGMPKPVRVQNAFISTDEVEKIVEHIGNQQGYPEPYILPTWEEESGEQNEWDPSSRDPLFEQAAKVVINTGQASVSNLQRRMSIGYARAARIMDDLEAAGIVGPQRGSKPRDVLLDSESQLEAYL